METTGDGGYHVALNVGHMAWSLGHLAGGGGKPTRGCLFLRSRAHVSRWHCELLRAKQGSLLNATY